MELKDFDGRLRELFDIKSNPRSYLCILTWMANKSVVMDTMALDVLLHERHGEYETEKGMSMAELIEHEYGEGARLWVQSMI